MSTDFLTSSVNSAPAGQYCHNVSKSHEGFWGKDSMVRLVLRLVHASNSFAQKLCDLSYGPNVRKENIKAMIQIEHLDTRALMQMLAEYTEKFTRLFRIYKRINLGKGYLRCKYTIEAILNALKKRGVGSKTEVHVSRYEAVCLSGL